MAMFDISTPKLLKLTGKTAVKAMERELHSVVKHQEVKNANAEAVLASEIKERKLKQASKAKERAKKLAELLAEVSADTTDVKAINESVDKFLDSL